MPNILCIQLRLLIDGNPFNREKALVASGGNFLLIDARVRNVISFCENSEFSECVIIIGLLDFKKLTKKKMGQSIVGAAHLQIVLIESWFILCDSLKRNF